jgi:CRP-like cAMP-binding protein
VTVVDFDFPPPDGNKLRMARPASLVGSPRENQLLSALSTLSTIEWQWLERAIKPVFLPLGHVVYEPNAQREHVYFPTTSIISLSYVLADGGSAEFAVVGNDGFVGVPVFMGGATMPSRATVQSEGWAYRLASRIFHAEFEQGVATQQLLLRYAQALITQIAQTAVCNRHHSIEQRVCRRLLLSLDRGTADEVTLTHDVLANLLGVWRDGVTKATRELQRRGIIHYHRGHIAVINRAGLEATCCECYGVMKRESDRMQGRYADVAGLPGYRAGNPLIGVAHRVPARIAHNRA